MFDILPNYIEVFFKVLGQGIGPTPGPFPDDSLSTGGPSAGLIVFFFIIILICAASAGMYFYIQFLKKEDRDTKTKSGVLLEVRVPSTNEWEIGVAERMFSNLYGIGGLGKGLKKYITVNNWLVCQEKSVFMYILQKSLLI